LLSRGDRRHGIRPWKRKTALSARPRLRFAAKSREAFPRFPRLQVEDVIAVHDAVFIEKDDEGNVAVNETIDPQPGGARPRVAMGRALGERSSPGRSHGVGPQRAQARRARREVIDVGIPARP